MSQELSNIQKVKRHFYVNKRTGNLIQGLRDLVHEHVPVVLEYLSNLHFSKYPREAQTPTLVDVEHDLLSSCRQPLDHDIDLSLSKKQPKL